MMVKEKRDIRPVVLKLGVAVVLSLGGILYTFFVTKTFKPSSDSGKQVDSNGVRNADYVLQRTASSCNSTSTGPQKHEEASPSTSSTENVTSGRSNGEKDCFLLPEFNELVEEFSFAAPNAGCSPCEHMETLDQDGETPSEFESIKRGNDEREIRSLRNMVKSLKERERELELQLLEYHGIKEQEAAFMELQNRLKINNMEAKLYILKIESLQADKRRLEALVANHARVSAELEGAKAKIKQLRNKLRSDHERNKEQILVLQERVMKLQEQENEAVTTHVDIQAILQRRKDLELERDELRKANSDLRLENSELAQKLEQVQLRATSVLGDEKTALQEENRCLITENDDLRKQIEQLQADRCIDAEELVYLRWINACLRYELRNYQPGPGKTIARDLSKTLSPKSEEKAKQLILEYATKEGFDKKGLSRIYFDPDQWSSSHASHLTDSGESDASSVDMSSADNTHSLTKTKVLGKLMQLLHGKGSQHHSRSSSAEMITRVEDAGGRYSPGCSPGVSTEFDAGADQMNNRSQNSSQGSRYSLELRRSDDASSRIFRAIDSMSEDATASTQVSRFNQHSEDVQKSELVKYAEVLKGSHNTSCRRRSASFSSF